MQASSVNSLGIEPEALRRSLQWLSLWEENETEDKIKKRRREESEKSIVEHNNDCYNSQQQWLNVQFNAFHYISTFRDCFWVFAPVFTKVFDQGVPLIMGKDLNTFSHGDSIFALNVILPLAQGALMCGNVQGCRYLVDLVENFLRTHSVPHTYPLTDALLLKATLNFQFEGGSKRVHDDLDKAMQICRENEWRHSDVYLRCMCLKGTIGDCSGEELIALNKEFGEVRKLPYCSYYVEKQDPGSTSTMPISLFDFKDITSVGMIQFHVEVVYELYQSTGKSIHKERLEDTIKILESLSKKVEKNTWASYIKYSLWLHILAVLSQGYWQLGKSLECKQSLQRYATTLHSSCVESSYSGLPLVTSLRLVSKICVSTNNLDILRACYSSAKKFSHVPVLKKLEKEFAPHLKTNQDFTIHKGVSSKYHKMPKGIEVPELKKLKSYERTKRRRTGPPSMLSNVREAGPMPRTNTYPPIAKETHKKTLSQTSHRFSERTPTHKNVKKVHTSRRASSNSLPTLSADCYDSMQQHLDHFSSCSLRWHNINPSPSCHTNNSKIHSTCSNTNSNNHQRTKQAANISRSAPCFTSQSQKMGSLEDHNSIYSQPAVGYPPPSYAVHTQSFEPNTIYSDVPAPESYSSSGSIPPYAVHMPPYEHTTIYSPESKSPTTDDELISLITSEQDVRPPPRIQLLDSMDEDKAEHLDQLPQQPTQTSAEESTQMMEFGEQNVSAFEEFLEWIDRGEPSVGGSYGLMDDLMEDIFPTI